MAFFLLCISIFIMFFQPVSVFPLLDAYSPVKNSAIIALVAYLATREKSDAPFLNNNINRYFLLFVMMQILSASMIWLNAGYESFNLWLRYGIVYFLIIKSGISANRIRTLMLMIVLAISYLSYYSIINFALRYEPEMRASGFGWYENANDLSVILVSVIPFAFLLAETASSSFKRYLYIGLAAAFSFNILFTGSRNGLLGLLTVGGLSTVFSKKISGLMRMGLLSVLIISILTVGITTAMSRKDLSSLSGDASSENRILQWKACVRMVIDRPLFGVGPGESRFHMRDYGGIQGLSPHNTIFQVFAETGILGGFFFFLFGFTPFIESWFFFRNRFKILEESQIEEEEHDSLITTYKYLSISLIGFWVCAFFSNRVEAYILYVTIALIVATQQNLLSESNSEESEDY